MYTRRDDGLLVIILLIRGALQWQTAYVTRDGMPTVPVAVASDCSADFTDSLAVGLSSPVLSRGYIDQLRDTESFRHECL